MSPYSASTFRIHVPGLILYTSAINSDMRAPMRCSFPRSDTRLKTVGTDVAVSDERMSDDFTIADSKSPCLEISVRYGRFSIRSSPLSGFRLIRDLSQNVWHSSSLVVFKLPCPCRSAMINTRCVIGLNLASISRVLSSVSSVLRRMSDVPSPLS